MAFPPTPLENAGCRSPPCRRCPVSLGTQATVQPVLGENTHLLLEKTKAGSLQQLVTLADSVEAPVAAGSQLGTLTITSRGRGRGGAAHPGRRGDPTGHLQPDAGPDAADGLPLRLTAVGGAAPPEIPADCDRFPLCPVSEHGIIKQQTRAALRKRGRS